MVALLATLDIPALKNLKLTLETLDLLNYPRDRWRLVLNRADSKVGLAAQRGREDAQGTDLGADPELARRPGLDQPRRADRARRPQAPGDAGDQGVRRERRGRRPVVRARRPSRPGCAPTAAACCAGRARPMSLADRLAAAQRERGVSGAETVPAQTASPLRRRGRGAVADPFAELKRTVHQTLLDNLGPKLYDSRLTQAELEQKVRQTLQEVLAQDDTPLTVADRARIAQEIADDILGYGPLEPYLRDPDVTEVMVNGLRLDLHRAGRADPPGRRHVHRRGAPAPHDRQDRGAGRPPGRRVQPDGRRPAARRQPGQRRSSRRWPSTARCSRSASSPPTPTMVEDLIGFGTMTRAVSRTSSSSASAAGSTSWSPAAPAPARRRRSTCCRRSSRATSASSPSRTPPSCSCTRSTCCGSSPGRRTSRARARSRSATWSATRCACGPTASSSARSATPPRSTCCRR